VCALCVDAGGFVGASTRAFVSRRLFRCGRARTAAEIAHAIMCAQPPRFPPPERSFAMTSYSLTHLRGRELEASYDRVASAGARTTALQLAHIAELDHQGYYLDAGYSSMFRYCVNGKGLSDDVAVQWIRAARVGRTCPGIFEAIAEGRLNVSAVCLLKKHLTPANTAELIAAVERRSIKQVLRVIAERFGRASKLDSPPTMADNSLTVPATLRVRDSAVSRGAGDDPLAPTLASVEASAQVADPDVEAAPPAVPPRRARVEPIGAGQFELVAVLGQEAYDQLEASRELLGHAIPSGALIEVLERAIALQHKQLLTQRCGATDRPRTNATGNPRSRRIPRAVRRAVWARDGGQCAFVSADGHRCEERSKLEMDHIVPVAKGGASTVDNLRLLCRAHNRHAADRVFGRDHMKARREVAQRHRAAERFYKRADRERVEKRRAEIERQREELGEAFHNMGYRSAEVERALGCCATRPEAPPEERIRYALSFMPPRAPKESPPAASAA
jgi:5-methylcytosine-specific restriction endonuclease McrA